MRWTIGARGAVAGLLLVVVGCGQARYESNWAQLHTGMTRYEVENLLGPPSSRVRLEQARGHVARERWQYGDETTSAASPTGLGMTPPDDVFVVTFGADGKVTDFRRPLDAPAD